MPSPPDSATLRTSVPIKARVHSHIRRKQLPASNSIVVMKNQKSIRTHNNTSDLRRHKNQKYQRKVNPSLQGEAVLASSSNPLCSMEQIKKTRVSIESMRRSGSQNRASFNLDMHDVNANYKASPPKIASSIEPYRHQIVEEVADGEETPMIKNTQKKHTSIKNFLEKGHEMKSQASSRQTSVQPLFPLPEGSISYETVRTMNDRDYLASSP